MYKHHWGYPTHRKINSVVIKVIVDIIVAGSMQESVAASRVEKALSEVASSYQSSLWVRQGPQHSWGGQSQIWRHLGNLSSTILLFITL